MTPLSWLWSLVLAFVKAMGEVGQAFEREERPLTRQEMEWEEDTALALAAATSEPLDPEMQAKALRAWARAHGH